MFKAEEYYRTDSVKLALNGDGQYDGFLKVINKYSGTDAANIAEFYAGSCYLKLNENENAVKYLKKFSTTSKPLQARAYKLLADAYADLGKNSDALTYYKKAAHHFESDQAASAEALFIAAYFADRVMKNPKEAIALYKELKEKFPKAVVSSANNEMAGNLADNFLAQLGVYNTEN
jgi:tetratricopeptide (TPR) repeat protein